MLKAIKRLSMNATLLEVLQNANAIEILTRIIDEELRTPQHGTSHVPLFLIVYPVYNDAYYSF